MSFNRTMTKFVYENHVIPKSISMISILLLTAGWVNIIYVAWIGSVIYLLCNIFNPSV